MWSHNFHDTTLRKSCSSVSSNKIPIRDTEASFFCQFESWPLSFTQGHFHITALYCKLPKFRRLDEWLAKRQTTSPFIWWEMLILWSDVFPPTGLRSSSISSRTVWWRIIPSGPPPISSWNIRSSETSRTRGRSASSSRTTSITRARRGARKVRLHLSCLFVVFSWT